jgi:hypothetical protein
MAGTNRPSKEEIVKAVVAFLKEELAPHLKGGLRFQSLISASLLEVVLREMTLDPDSFMDPAELEHLLGIGGLPGPASPDAKEARLCELIREGVFDEGPAREALLQYLSKQARYKIQVDNPKW